MVVCQLLRQLQATHVGPSAASSAQIAVTCATERLGRAGDDAGSAASVEAASILST